MGRHVARPLGRRHAGRRDAQLHARDRPARIEPEPAPRRALHARSTRRVDVRIHRGRSDDLDETVDRANSDAADRRSHLRICVPRGKLRDDQPAQGRAAARKRISFDCQADDTMKIQTRLTRLFFACAVAFAAATSLSAQSKSLSRTADGHPDLQGVYNVATMTPVERPGEYCNRLVLTKEEVAAIEGQERERQAKGAEPSQGDRQAPQVGGDRSPTNSYLEGLFRAGGGIVGGYNLFWIAPGSQLARVDGQAHSSLIVDPADGRVPPMKAEARARNEAILARRVSPDAAEGAPAGPAGAYDGPEARPLAERCLLGFSSTSGPPTLPNYWYNNLKQVVQTRDTVMILNEMVHDARIIRIGGQHLPAAVRL